MYKNKNTQKGLQKVLCLPINQRFLVNIIWNVLVTHGKYNLQRIGENQNLPFCPCKQIKTSRPMWKMSKGTFYPGNSPCLFLSFAM